MNPPLEQSELWASPGKNSFLISINLYGSLFCPNTGRAVVIVKELEWIIKRMNYLAGDAEQVHMKCSHCRKLHRIPFSTVAADVLADS